MTNLIERFLNQLAAEEKSPETLAHYGEELSRFEKWLGERYSLSLTEEHVPEVTAVMLSEYYQEGTIRMSTGNLFAVDVYDGHLYQAIAGSNNTYTLRDF